MMKSCHFCACVSITVLIGLCDLHARAADWPMLGRNKTRNAVSLERNPPLFWQLKGKGAGSGTEADQSTNIKWTARLGSQTFATPVIADGQVYIGTNNGGGYLKRYPSNVDLGCLLCFRESDGEFLWQFSAAKIGSRTHDWPLQGLVASPLVEGDRMWFVSNRNEVVCLDTQGFRDGENDGPDSGEPVAGPNEADVVWRFDLIKELGVFPHNAGMGPNRRCSPAASYRNRIYVVTGNGPDGSLVGIPAPEAPSLVCFDKDTGKVLWTDASPGKNILKSQSADPLVIEVGGRGQVIVPQGDGWIRSFDALTGKLIWKFDINLKESRWILGGRGTRNNILSPPVHYKGRIYIGGGQELEHGEGPGRLVCIDPTKTGDISSELAVDADGNSIPHRRHQAVDPERGEMAIPNPNSGLIWEYTGKDHNGNGKLQFDETFHRTVSSVAIRNDVLMAVDFSGLVHCFHAQTGEQHWTYDAFAAVSSSSPLIVDDYVYVADEDGDVAVFRLSANPETAMKKTKGDYSPIAEITMDNAIYSAPVFANGVLYIASKNQLTAIAVPDAGKAIGRLDEPQPCGQPKKTDVRTARESTESAGRVPKPVFLPTPQDVVEAMLNAAQVSDSDTVVDLGSGDGRIVITAAKRHGAKAIGYEIDPALVESSRESAKQAGMTKLVEIRQQDMYTADLSKARVVTAFLYPGALQKLKSQFARMKPESWIVSHHFEIPETEPTRVVIFKSEETGDKHRVLLYRTPLLNRPKRE